MKKLVQIFILMTSLFFFGSESKAQFCDQPKGTAGFPNDLSCAISICSYDPYCCATVWDAICAGEAASDAACEQCRSTYAPVYCDQPQGSSGFPDNVGCQNSVCSYDAHCCSSIWDAICAAEAASDAACVTCRSGYTLPPPLIYCNEPQGIKGFPINLGCQTSVCSYDPYCCSTQWDALCAAEAASDVACATCLSNPDFVCHAIPVNIGVNGPFSNTTASSEPGEVVPPSGSGGNSCDSQNGWCSTDLGVQKSLWFTFVAPASGHVTILASGFDTQLALWDAQSCQNFGAFNLIAANDNGGGAHGGSANSSWLDATTCLIPGKTYYLQLDGYSGATGSATITITLLGNNPPVISGCPSSFTASSINPTWTPPTATDPEGCNVSLTSNYNPGDTFPIGIITVTYAASDQADLTSLCSFSITVNGCPYSSVPPQPSPIVGNTTVCPNTNTYSIPAVTNTTSYTWSIPANSSIISGQGTNTVDIQFDTSFTIGVITVYATNCKGNSSTRSLTAKVINYPKAPGTITGPSPVCIGTYSFSIAPTSYASSYIWSTPPYSTVVSGQGTTNVDIQFDSLYASGSVTVFAVNCRGNSSTRSKTVSTIAKPATPGTISGNTTVCPIAYTYSIGAVTNAITYTWITPANAIVVSGQGTTSAQIEFNSSFVSGYVSVYASNCKGNSSSKTLLVKMLAKPATPIITGQNYGNCGATNVSYSVSAVPNVTFNWSVSDTNACSIISGQGTNNINVNFASSFTSVVLSVYGSNSCGINGTSKAMTIYAKPNVPGAIVGDSTPCASQSFVYSITPLNGATTYQWTAPNNATISDGINTVTAPAKLTTTSTSVTITYASESGNITVKGVNACTYGSTKTMSVNLTCQ